MPVDSRTIEELELEAEQLQLEMKFNAVNLALARKRGRNNGEGDEEVIDRPAKKIKQVESDDAKDGGPNLQGISMKNDDEEAKVGTNSKFSVATVDDKEYYRRRIFTRPPEGMILNRPKGVINPEKTSPWCLPDHVDHDGYLLFTQFVRDKVKVMLDVDLNWLKQTKIRRDGFINMVRSEYPILQHQVGAFTIILVTSSFLSHSSSYVSKKKKSTPKNSKSQGKTRRASHSDDTPVSDSSRATSSIPSDIDTSHSVSLDSSSLPDDLMPVTSNQTDDSLMINSNLPPGMLDPSRYPIYQEGGIEYEVPDMPSASATLPTTPLDVDPLLVATANLAPPPNTPLAPASSVSRRQLNFKQPVPDPSTSTSSLTAEPVASAQFTPNPSTSASPHSAAPATVVQTPGAKEKKKKKDAKVKEQKKVVEPAPRPQRSQAAKSGAGTRGRKG